MKESGAQAFFRRIKKAVFHGGALQKAACMHKTGLPLDLAQRETVFRYGVLLFVFEFTASLRQTHARKETSVDCRTRQGKTCVARGCVAKAPMLL